MVGVFFLEFSLIFKGFGSDLTEISYGDLIDNRVIGHQFFFVTSFSNPDRSDLGVTVADRQIVHQSSFLI
ncbi:hypothetical protein M6B38_277665 [Iris pallida]|uniref:Photosystem II protein D1 n=1 Tax=Iris pallida TaxID=29817 RepID=A0AAX6I467_IRIPA|nr:hypothetical protein M6B38_277665 [Iris pallida]